MAYTLKQLHTARGAGLKLAKALQDFAQVDIKTTNILNADVAAEIQTAADEAVTAAYAIGGNADLPADQAVVINGFTAVLKTAAGTTITGSGTVHVAANALTDVTLPATIAAVQSGLLSVAATGTGTKVTITVTNGLISAVTLSA